MVKHKTDLNLQDISEKRIEKQMKNHRTACVRRNLKDGLALTPPCHRQGDHPLDQAAQRPIQPGLKHLQGIHIFSGQPVPASSSGPILTGQHPSCSRSPRPGCSTPIGLHKGRVEGENNLFLMQPRIQFVFWAGIAQ